MNIIGSLFLFTRSTVYFFIRGLTDLKWGILIYREIFDSWIKTLNATLPTTPKNNNNKKKNLSSNNYTFCVHFVFRHKSSKNLEKEAVHLNGLEYFDPFVERNLEHPTTWVNTDKFRKTHKISKSFNISMDTNIFSKKPLKFRHFS